MKAAFDDVVQHLVGKLRVRKRSSARPARGSREAPFLFLVGAGCSMQYGLPGYGELLRLLLTEKLDKEVPPGSRLQDLQDLIEEPWRLNQGHHREWLEEYLGGLDGAHCLGYRRLARLLKQGWIDGVVNLNFDRLFAQACTREDGLALHPLPSLPRQIRRPFLVEPHGGLGELSAPPALDLRATRLAKFDPARLLATANVVVVGYGAGDDRILQALGAKKKSPEPVGNLFYFNLEIPQERKPREDLFSTLDWRNQDVDLAPIEASCTFENLMEALDGELAPRRRRGSPAERTRVDSTFEPFTRSEAAALTECRRLADRLRLAASVAESSPIELAEHALEVADLAFRLARAAGVRLLPLEKVLLHTVALFHDLGYYWSAGHERFGRYQGWRIHRLHGAMVARMLLAWWREHPQLPDGLIPLSYRLAEADRRRYVELVFWLCSHHNRLAPAEETPGSTVTLEVAGVEMPVRRRLLQVLISAAEHLALEHPFQPSLDPVLHDGRGLGTIDDPVLDLFLVRRRGTSLALKVDGSQVQAAFNDPAAARRPMAKFFVARTRRLMAALSSLAQRSGGRRVQFRSNVRRDHEWGAGMLGARGVATCLEDSLREAADEVSDRRIDAHIALLDLLAIYCLGNRAEGRSEPRVSCPGSPAVHRIMERVWATDPEDQRKSLVQEFVEGQVRGGGDTIDAEFARCFEERIFPAWRFLGRKWHDGIEAPTTALTALEMGSSRYRSEVIVGLRKLLRDKISWRGHLAQAHEGCVLCCSRLAIAFSYARLLFEEQELEELFVDFRGFTLLDALRGLLRYFLDLDAGDARWGGGPALPDKVAGLSADYLAFAAGAISFFLSTEDLVRARGGSPLDLTQPRRRVQGRAPVREWCPKKAVEELFRERWAALFRVTSGELLGPDVEEPHSLVLGRIALVILSRDYFSPRVAAAVDPEGASSFAKALFAACERLEEMGLSHLGRLNLWPALLLLDRERPSADLARRNLERYRECMDSSIWVRRGSDFGSWGFNVRTTAVVCSALNAFWRHVLFVPGNRERYRELWSEAGSERATAGPSSEIPEDGLPEPVSPHP